MFSEGRTKIINHPDHSNLRDALSEFAHKDAVINFPHNPDMYEKERYVSTR